jgi:cation diffusion facilitator CzcD-associated flavoprotein CzcO
MSGSEQKAMAMSPTNLPRVCIIGAGPSGITTAKRMKEFGIPFDCYEASDEVGGNWYYKNPNGMSACYQSLHIDTSKWRLAFEDFPVSADLPDFPHHSELFQYFKDYVEHFGLRESIIFNTSVVAAERDTSGLWTITRSDGEVRTYDVLMVCNGHHWDPNIPDYPGEFDGVLMHSHSYNDPFDPIDMRGKKVVVVGMGNSGLDIASELGQRYLAEKLTVSARRGVWVLPKYLGGVPGDKLITPPWMPRGLRLFLSRRFLGKNLGTMEGYGLPKPDHRPFEAHPSASGEFLGRAGSGDISFKPAITKLDGKQVHFADGTAEDVDVIVCATGYNISFPFFSDPNLLPDRDNRFPLFKRMMKPGIDNLFFMGLAQPMPTLVNFAEQQSKLVAAYLTGKYQLPSAGEMQEITKADEAYFLAPYYKSPRHTIQLEFDPYVRNMNKEIAKGTKRAEASGNKLPVTARAAAHELERADRA